jgi:hypothetical protein
VSRRPLLTPEQAAEIREFYSDRAAKWTVTALARSYHVNPWIIQAVLNRTGAYQPPSRPGEPPQSARPQREQSLN